MTNRRMTTQTEIWTIMAILGPVLFYSKGCWLEALVATAVVSVVVFFLHRFGQHWCGPIYSAVQALWLSIYLSQMLSYSAMCWPTGERSFPVVPLVLLILAAVSVTKGEKETGNGICVLFWVAVSLLGFVVISGFSNIDLPEPSTDCQFNNIRILPILLLPATVMFDREKGRITLILFSFVLVVTSVAFWIDGTLTYQLAMKTVWPFYESAKSVQFLETAKRFESLVSVGITICNYALYSFLLKSIACIGEKFNRRNFSITAGTVVSGGLTLIGVVIPPVYLIIFSLILWVILPLFGAVNIKKNE